MAPEGSAFGVPYVHIKRVSQGLIAAARGKETEIACCEVLVGGGGNAENIKRCAEYLKKTDWSGVLSVECYGSDDNIRMSIEFLRGLLT